MTAVGRLIRIAAYNVHGWVGPNGRRDIARFVDMIRELNADVVGLQEVVMPPLLEAECLERAVAGPLGMAALPGPTLVRHRNDYGNAMLTRLPLASWRSHDLSVAGCEPRGAIEAVVDAWGVPFRIIATHFGLRPGERRRQARMLLAILRQQAAEPVAVLGDFNEWLPRNRSVRLLDAHLGKPPSPATFPSCFPFLALDRLWVSPANLLQGLRVHRSPRRACSDHLPLVADVLVQAPAGEPAPGRSIADD